MINHSGIFTREKFFPFFMKLVAVHSLGVGCALVFFPGKVIAWFGFPLMEGNFFQVQGGVFHILMGVAYLTVSSSPLKYRGLVFLSVTAKGMATVFLLVYYFGVNPIGVVLLSGIGDGLMGMVMWVSYRIYLGVRS